MHLKRVLLKILNWYDLSREVPTTLTIFVLVLIRVQGTHFASIFWTLLFGCFLPYEPNRVVHVVFHSTEISESVNFSEMSVNSKTRPQ